MSDTQHALYREDSNSRACIALLKLLLRYFLVTVAVRHTGVGLRRGYTPTSSYFLDPYPNTIHSSISVWTLAHTYVSANALQPYATSSSIAFTPPLALPALIVLTFSHCRTVSAQCAHWLGIY